MEEGRKTRRAPLLVALAGILLLAAMWATMALAGGSSPAAKPVKAKAALPSPRRRTAPSPASPVRSSARSRNARRATSDSAEPGHKPGSTLRGPVPASFSRVWSARVRPRHDPSLGPSTSERFYETVLSTLGIEQTHSGEHCAEWDDFSLAQADGEHPPTRRLHIGFVAPLARARRRVLAGRHRGGIPGRWRARPAPPVQRRLLRRVPARPRRQQRRGRPSRVDARRAETSTISGSASPTSTRRPGSTRRSARRRASGSGERRASATQFACVSGSFSVLAGDEPTEHVHLAFPATDNETVDRFHREATRRGLPRQRPARRAGDLPRGLLRRVRARPGRKQRRGGEPQPVRARG